MKTKKYTKNNNFEDGENFKKDNYGLVSYIRVKLKDEYKLSLKHIWDFKFRLNYDNTIGEHIEEIYEYTVYVRNTKDFIILNNFESKFKSQN